MTVKTVLIVDDDLNLCDNLEDILQDEGYQPFSAVTYADGLKLARKRRPKMALLDLKLPDGQGTALLSDLKRLYPDCLCIIMTAYHYLQKPVHPTELLRVLERAFETIQLRYEKRQAEEALKKYSERLEKMIQERTAELKTAKEAAEAANRAKSEFLANMSHENCAPRLTPFSASVSLWSATLPSLIPSKNISAPSTVAANIY